MEHRGLLLFIGVLVVSVVGFNFYAASELNAEKVYRSHTLM